MTWAGIGQTCSSMFVHASSWPNTVLVMVKQNFFLFLMLKYGGGASVASPENPCLSLLGKTCALVTLRGD